MIVTSEQAVFEVAAQVLRQTIAVSADSVKAETTQPCGYQADIAFRGARRGLMSLRVSDVYGRVLVRQLLGEEELNSCAVVHDAVGELANILCGTLTAFLFGTNHHTVLGIPTVFNVSEAEARGTERTSWAPKKNTRDQQERTFVSMLVNDEFVISISISVEGDGLRGEHD